MQTYRVTVGPDGQVKIPETRPGETITIQVKHDVEQTEYLTRATARTEEERAAVAAAIRANAQVLRELLKDDLPISTDELYGEDGLPR
jgi:hypothetical protein